MIKISLIFITMISVHFGCSQRVVKNGEVIIIDGIKVKKVKNDSIVLYEGVSFTLPKLNFQTISNNTLLKGKVIFKCSYTINSFLGKNNGIDSSGRQ